MLGGACNAREKTSAAIRKLSEPIYVGMTATEELIAKQVSDVFPASVDDLPLTAEISLEDGQLRASATADRDGQFWDWAGSLDLSNLSLAIEAAQ